MARRLLLVAISAGAIMATVVVVAACGPSTGHSGLTAQRPRDSTASTTWSAMVATTVPIPDSTTISQPRSPERPADLELHLGKRQAATVEPLLGVNAGPLPAGRDSANADLTAGYRQIGVNLVRTHDFYGPLDMAVMYPDLMKDPTDPRSYNFEQSDAAWRAIVDGGFEPYLRLGDSWNNVRPPAAARERDTWVRACVEIVRHYREGKWHGFVTPFRYVEIWNEPDHPRFWPKPASRLQYYQLYVEAAQALKDAFPDLRIGGPGLTQAGFATKEGHEWIEGFLGFVKDAAAPLDFLSWHLYSNHPEDWVQAARFYRGALDAAGLEETQLHVTEWNTDTRNLADTSAECLALRTGGRGASLLTAAWIAMQQNKVAVSTLYRGTDPSTEAPFFYGIFYADGRPKLTALAFSLWAELVRHPQLLEVFATKDAGLWLLAGQNEAGETAVLATNPSTAPVRYTLREDPSLHDAPVTIDRMRKTTLFEVSDAANEVLSREMRDEVIEIGAETVQLLVISK